MVQQGTKTFDLVTRQDANGFQFQRKENVKISWKIVEKWYREYVECGPIVAMSTVVDTGWILKVGDPT